FSFIELPDEFTTGSSIMPQKKNPDLLELIRGKCGSVYGNLISLLTILKGLPLSYNRDLQEDKTQIFDTIYNYKNTVKIIDRIVENVTVNRKRLSEAALDNYSTATDLADYLTMKGLPFRESHNITGKIVLYAIKEKKNLNELTLNEFKKFSDKISEDIYEFIDINNSINRKKSYGGTARVSVEKQIESGWKFVNAQNC
ncbi:MAG: lyase family protein, partial [Deferribacterota bacterium]|nr:lyase family protein [Deferribacterota bacterium]